MIFNPDESMWIGKWISWEEREYKDWRFEEI